MIKQLLLTAAMAAISLSACAQPGSDAATSRHETGRVDIREAALGDAVTERSEFLEDWLLDKRTLKKIDDEFGAAGVSIIRRSYAVKLFKPIWTPAGTNSLRYAIDDTFEHGIIAEDVFSGSVDKLIKKRFQSKSLEKQAKADIKLSLLWMRYAKAMSGDLSGEGGMIRRKGSPVMRYNMPTSLLSSAAGGSDKELMALAPEAPQYHALKDSLKVYRDIRRNGGWLAIRDGEALELGDKDERVPALRARLKAEGYDVLEMSSKPVQPMPVMLGPLYLKSGGNFEEKGAGANKAVLDESLVAALKDFQKHHGLETDGILGGNTLKALNESVESKISRIAESMYRWRSQGDLGERYIWANIPSYTAEGWNGGKMEIAQRTIVGKVRFATPEFSDEVEYLVANPKWFLPVSIVRRQKLSKLRKDPGYAERYGYNIFDRESGAQVNAFDVDWTESGAARKYRFVQEPGEGNALGQMKIIFPNQYSIYLHGTPGKHLFDRAQRAFSSGCVRLEDPVSMAKWIARHDDEAEVAVIKEAMADEERTKLNLDEHLPVHITYMTVTSKLGEKPYFWADVYDRYNEGIKYVTKYERKKNKRAYMMPIEGT